jgi:DNA polymerase-1
MIITEEKQFEEFLEVAEKHPIIVYDTETTGLLMYGGDRIVGHSFFIPYNPEDKDTDGFKCYMPFRHTRGDNLPLTYFKHMARIFADSRKALVGWNLRFDTEMLRNEEITVHNQHMDVMLAAHLANENEFGFSLKGLGAKYVGEDAGTPEKILNDKLKRIKQSIDKYHPDKKHRVAKQYMGYLDPSEVADYAIQDVVLTWKLLKIYQKALEHQGILDIWLEVNQYVKAVVGMERQGLLISPERCLTNKAECERKCDSIYKKMMKSVGYPFNPRSHPQVSNILGQKETDRAALAKCKHPIARLLEEYRRWDKAKNTYFTKFLQLKDKHNRIHSHLSMIGTISGRLSCRKPNLQALPRKSDTYKVRPVVVAPQGHALLAVDYSQAELRILAHYTKDPFLLKTYENNEDIHQSIADRVKIDRNIAKRLNFGIVYGLGVNEAMLQFNLKQKDARQLLNDYHAQIPGIRKLYNAIDNFAQRHGFIALWTGRRRHYRKHDETWKAMSNLIQGGVAEMMRVAITKLEDALMMFNTNMILQVHDEVLFEVPLDELKMVASVVKKIMEDFDFAVPIVAESKVGLSWGEMKPLEESELMPAQGDLFEGVL